MSSNALELLREFDPARTLAALDEHARQAHRDHILEQPFRSSEAVNRRTVRRRFAQVAAVGVAVLVFGVGVAWASGFLSPLGLFENNAEQDGNPPGSVWDQSVVPDTVREISSVDRASGAEAPVHDGLFELAVADPTPTGRTPFHLVALDADGTVVADDCPSCSP